MAGSRSQAASKMLEDFQPDEDDGTDDDGGLDAEAEEINSKHIDFGASDAQGVKNIYKQGQKKKEPLPTE